MADETGPLLDQWRQGDLALVAIELPALVLEDDEIAWHAIDAPHGVAVLSQSCYIVRSVEQRPFIQIAGLVPATPEELERAARGEVPSRIYLDSLSAHFAKTGQALH